MPRVHVWQFPGSLDYGGGTVHLGSNGLHYRFETPEAIEETMMRSVVSFLRGLGQ